MVNVKTPKDVAEREEVLRRRGFNVYDGPSSVQRGVCFPGAPGHGHLTDSTHFVDAGGGFGGRRFGGAVDVGRDPSKDVPISNFEKAHLDDLAQVLQREGFRVIWGVDAHFDHLHFDYNVGGGHQLNLIGPNGGFTVAHIATVQTGLSQLRRQNNRHYYTRDIDGLREEHTLKAIKAFQRDHGLKDDGDPGRLTSEAIKSALARQKAAEKKAADKKAADKKAADKKAAEKKAADKKAAEAGKKPKNNDPSVVGLAGLDGPTLRERMAPFRIAGQNAFATAVAADRFVPPAGAGVLLAARGTPDEPAGSLAAFRTGGSFLPLRADGRLPGPVRARLQEIRPAWVRVVGGFLAVPDETVAEVLTAAGIRF